MLFWPLLERQEEQKYEVQDCYVGKRRFSRRWRVGALFRK